MLLRSNRNQQGDDGYSVDLALERDGDKEREMLSCCYCDAPLEAIMLETNAKTGEQRLLWACKNMKKKSCFFPMGLPSEAFFLKRSALEKEEGIIPKPNIRALPKEYWGLYPTVFADKIRSSNQSNTARAGTSMSNHIAEYSPCPTNSSTVSGSSVSSDHAAVDQLLRMDRDTSTWGGCSSRSNETGVASSSSGAQESSRTDDRNKTTEKDSDSNISSFDGNDKSGGSVLAELICDHLQYTGVDIGRLEDDELVQKMAGVVRKLHKEKPRVRYPGNFTLSEYRASLDYLYNLDVAPIKRKLNVMSADLTHAVAVMRSKCDIDTMLVAMGGSNPALSPPVKRSRTMATKEEWKKRVEVILKSLAERGERETANTASEAITAEGDPTGAQEWYEGEDGPSNHIVSTPETIGPTSSEEERLNAFVQEKVRSRIECSAARRHARRRRKTEGSSLQIEQETQPPTSHELHLDTGSTSDHYDGGLLLFDSPYMEGLEDDHSSITFPPDNFHQQSHSIVEEEGSISNQTHSHNTLLSPDLHSSVGDDEFNSLFNGYEFSY